MTYALWRMEMVTPFSLENEDADLRSVENGDGDPLSLENGDGDFPKW